MQQNNKCTCIKYVFSHIINYQYVWITITIIISIALHEYRRYTINCQIV